MKVVYGSANCAGCKNLTAEYDRDGIEYKYVDVKTLSAEELKSIAEESGQMGLPIVIER